MNIDDLFTYHAPNAEQREQLQAINDAAKHLAHVIVANTPPGADQSAAIRKVREARMTANAAVVCGRAPAEGSPEALAAEHGVEYLGFQDYGDLKSRHVFAFNLQHLKVSLLLNNADLRSSRSGFFGFFAHVESTEESPRTVSHFYCLAALNFQEAIQVATDRADIHL